MTITQRSESRNKWQQCRKITKTKSLNQYALAHGEVVSTKETDGRLRAPQLKTVMHMKAVTLTADDMRQNRRGKPSFI